MQMQTWEGNAVLSGDSRCLQRPLTPQGFVGPAPLILSSPFSLLINLSVKKQFLQDVTETEYTGSWTTAVCLMCSVEFTNTIVLRYKQTSSSLKLAWHLFHCFTVQPGRKQLF